MTKNVFDFKEMYGLSREHGTSLPPSALHTLWSSYITNTTGIQLVQHNIYTTQTKNANGRALWSLFLHYSRVAKYKLMCCCCIYSKNKHHFYITFTTVIQQLYINYASFEAFCYSSQLYEEILMWCYRTSCRL